jgi:hypothetical protein
MQSPAPGRAVVAATECDPTAAVLALHLPKP